MISLLARFFCKSDGKSPAQLRTAYGILCGAVGIGLNLLLFFGKFFAWVSASPPRHRTRATPSAMAGRSTSPVWRCPC